MPVNESLQLSMCELTQIPGKEGSNGNALSILLALVDQVRHLPVGCRCHKVSNTCSNSQLTDIYFVNTRLFIKLLVDCLNAVGKKKGRSKGVLCTCI